MCINIIYRVIKDFIYIKQGKKNKDSLKVLISFICWIYNYNSKEFPAISLILKEYSTKVIFI